MIDQETTDKELVKKVLAGKAFVFKTIIANTQGLVIQIIYKMIKNPEDRKDLVQEVYLKVFNKLSSFKFKSKLSTWVGTITYNTCISFLEKKRIPVLGSIHNEEKNSVETLIDEKAIGNLINQTDLIVLNEERSRILTIEIDKLPPLYRTLIQLFHKQELSLNEISEITNLPVGTLKSYLYRARRELKKSLLRNYKKEDL